MIFVFSQGYPWSYFTGFLLILAYFVNTAKMRSPCLRQCLYSQMLTWGPPLLGTSRHDLVWRTATALWRFAGNTSVQKYFNENRVQNYFPTKIFSLFRMHIKWTRRRLPLIAEAWSEDISTLLQPLPPTVWKYENINWDEKRGDRVTILSTFPPARLCNKCRWYACWTMRQVKTYQSDFLDHICKKKIQKSCFLSSLIRLKVFTLINNLNTI